MKGFRARFGLRLGMVGAALLLLFPGPGFGQVETVPDEPRQRWEYFVEQRAFPFSAIPPGALQRARDQLRARQLGPRAAPPPIAGSTWEAFGPEGFGYRGRSTGRLTAIAVHPTNSNIIYIGGAQGGVWKTTNGGESWVPLTDDQCSLAMGSISIDPVDPEIIYAGTGEQHFSADSYYGCGVLRSEDGGATWTQLGAAVYVREEQSNARISRINVDPATAGTVASTTVLAASDLGLFRSTDGGETWLSVLTGTATDLIRNPADPQILYSSIRRTGVFKSTDGGFTWTQLTEGFPASDVGRINLALAPSSPETVFASVQHNSESNLLGIWKSVDGGENWTKLPSGGASCGSQCWYNMTIAVHPTDPNTVFFGGVSLYRSSNGGINFSRVNGDIHVDQHYLAFDPQDPETVYVGNDGGIYRSTDRGGDWTSLNTNLALTQFYAGISLHPWDATVALGGTQDNGTLVSSGVAEFSRVLGGDGGFTAIDFRNPDTRYAETQWVADRSHTGPQRSDGEGFVRKINGIDPAESALFIPPLVMDPTNPSRLYFGTVRLYRTDDRAENWTAITPELRARISTIAPATSSPDVVYVGTSAGSVQLTTDGGENWNEVDLGLPRRHIKDIAIDPVDWQIAFAVYSGYGSGHVFRTSDGGSTWDNISSNLPDIPVNAILLDPVERNTLFIGTDLGVFASVDGGSSWANMNDGLPNVAVFDLAYNPSTGVLLAGTHGRGMFSFTLNRSLTLSVVPPPRADSVLIGSTESVPDSATVVLTGTNSAVTQWTATHGDASWITLTGGTGIGTSPLSWSRDPTGMGQGTFIDTILVSAPGAIDSPYEFVDTMVVQAPRVMTVEPASRSHEAVVGSITPIPVTVAITITGPNSQTARWEATHGDAPWVTLNTPSRLGSGTVQWTRNPAGLTVGIYVDTIVISALGALGTPTAIVDSLVMTADIVGLDPSVRVGYGTAGAIIPTPDSARVLLNGDGAGTAQWTATIQGASWLTLTTANGVGPGILRWTRDPTGLGPGDYSETISVETTTGGQTLLTDNFSLGSPFVPPMCPSGHLLGSPCLSEVQARFLDLVGNGDGVYNLGDFLAYLERDGAGGEPVGGGERP